MCSQLSVACIHTRLHTHEVMYTHVGCVHHEAVECKLGHTHARAYIHARLCAHDGMCMFGHACICILYHVPVLGYVFAYC